MVGLGIDGGNGLFGEVVIFLKRDVIVVKSYELGKEYFIEMWL